MSNTIYQTWAEIEALLEKHDLPPIAIESLHHEEYILHLGSASLSSSLRVDDHDYRRQNPWIKAGGRPQYEGIDGAITGYVIDGDLTIDGNFVNGEDGAPAIIVLGDLRAKAILITGDTKLVVKGKIVTDFFLGGFTDSYVVVQGDFDARASIFWDEFSPAIVGGTLRTHLISPSYYDAAQDENIKQYLPTTPTAEPASLFIPEVSAPLSPSAKGFASFGVDGRKLFFHVASGHSPLR